MKHLTITLLTFLLIGCSATESEAVEVNQITTPTWARGIWIEDGGDLELKIEEHKITIEDDVITTGEASFDSNGAYQIENEIQEVLIFKAGERLFFRYKENGEILVMEYFL